MLEQSQVVQTIIPTVVGPKPPEGGIKFELEEVESRLAEYPYTLAFMQLIDQVLYLLHK